MPAKNWSLLPTESYWRQECQAVQNNKLIGTCKYITASDINIRAPEKEVVIKDWAGSKKLKVSQTLETTKSSDIWMPWKKNQSTKGKRFKNCTNN